MWHLMFAVQIPIAEKILRTVLVYATILILFRLTGKRDLATLNMLDFVVLFLAVQRRPEPHHRQRQQCPGGIIGGATLIAVNAALNRWLAVSKRAARVLEGKPTTIIENGASSQARPGGCRCGRPTWTTPSGCRTATTSRRWRLA